eukprot:4566436-Amphidinium_carterae.2
MPVRLSESNVLRRLSPQPNSCNQGSMLVLALRQVLARGTHFPTNLKLKQPAHMEQCYLLSDN